ncbi:conserved unknown protein [Ectocarpus siliculosus]|uniref:Uncharacterized protein n=1 Tax=Ectocarpus siliculosus TaxID=2880 RepID=D7G3Z1_ECTSI|nr:conserved unknown protein [Ectocarpus siliculosus]|eukprot:CBJ27026.1 conserved unknown protein [Ectocarpus siliculosus]
MGHDHSKPVKAVVGVLALASAASAFVAPGAAGRGLTQQQPTRTSATVVFGQGKYDGKLWDDAAKDDVKSMYNPNEPWSDNNFDPFVKDAAGNKCDSSGYYPGETMYKDPIRPAVSYADYLAAKAKKEAEGGN